ncbi:MAG: DNA polymerase/3'-5' exonuclease PolX [bacterium]
MQNRAVAQRFAQIADMLEIKGESVFRINAYRRAARAVEGLTEDIAAVAARGGLTGIPGIGSATAEKIGEFLATGTMKAYEDLVATLPAGLPALMAVPEVGPKTALMLHQQLGISTIDELEAAARDGRIRDLPRMGAKTEENILKGIAMVRRGAGRQLLGVVLPVAAALVERLREVPGVKDIGLAGSLRRMKDTVGDIDILVTSKKPDAVMDAFAGAPQVTQVLGRGPTRSSVILDVGVQADVRVVEPAAFGAALQYFTGSKEHNVALRERAVRRGLKVNEYGVWRVADGKRVAARSEADVYRAVGVPWIPPELREDEGEIDAALAGRLPTLIEVKDIRGDLHMHTTWSDGNDTAERMAKAAQALGYEYICITDHSDSQKFLKGPSVEGLRRNITEVRALADRLGFAVLIGTECEIQADGSVDYPDDLLADLDVVIAAVHSRFKMGRDEMTRRIVRAMENEHVDILGHPTGRKLGQRDPYEVDIEVIVETAIRTGTVLEIDAYPDRLDLKDTHVRLARERGARLAIGSDSHTVAHLQHMPYGVGVARRGWAEAKDVINTLPLPKLLDLLRRPLTGARRA